MVAVGRSDCTIPSNCPATALAVLHSVQLRKDVRQDVADGFTHGNSMPQVYQGCDLRKKAGQYVRS